MAKIEIKKTELAWKGKYDEDGRLKPVEKPGPYPFQIGEVVNEPRIGKEVKHGETCRLFAGAMLTFRNIFICYFQNIFYI